MRSVLKICLGLLISTTLALAGETPVDTTNKTFNEISEYITPIDLKAQLDKHNSITTRDRFGVDKKTFSREDLESGISCFEDPYAWDKGCIPVQRNYKPKYSPLALEYEARVSLRRAKERGEEIEDEEAYILAKKEGLKNSVTEGGLYGGDQQADESTGVGILDLTQDGFGMFEPETEEEKEERKEKEKRGEYVEIRKEIKRKRKGTDLDILTVFQRFNEYASMVSTFFKDCMELTSEHLTAKGVPVDEELGSRYFYQTSHIKMGLPKFKVHQTLRYEVTRHPKTKKITAAWKLDRRFLDPKGFKSFEYLYKRKPVFDAKTEDFTKRWKKLNMKYFPKDETGNREPAFQEWKKEFIKTVVSHAQTFEAWKNGTYVVHNNQFGPENVHEQTGFFSIEPYAPNRYFVVKHLYVRMDPTNSEFDLRKDRDEGFDNIRSSTSDRFINHEASALRKAIGALLSE